MHTWDLARATGQDDRLDPQTCADLLAGMEPIEELLRSSGQYGAAGAGAGDADVQTRLLASSAATRWPVRTEAAQPPNYVAPRNAPPDNTKVAVDGWDKSIAADYEDPDDEMFAAELIDRTVEVPRRPRPRRPRLGVRHRY